MHPLYRHIKNELASHYSVSECSALARWILSDVFGMSVTEIYSNKDDDFSANIGEKLANIINRLKLYEPMQYILRQAMFCGMPFEVTPDVLIPRPETEELVDWIVESHEKVNPSVLDIGTGSGCIAISLAKRLGATVRACDISSKALEVARRNAVRNGVEVEFLQMDILNDNINFKIDVIVSNPPYVTESERVGMARNVLDWEPGQALFVPDAEPLLFYRRIAQLSMDILSPGGNIYFEINRLYGKDIVRMLERLGYQGIVLRKDLSGNDRFIKAIRP